MKVNVRFLYPKAKYDGSTWFLVITQKPPQGYKSKTEALSKHFKHHNPILRFLHFRNCEGY